MVCRFGTLLLVLLFAFTATAEEREDRILRGAFDKKQFIAGPTVLVAADVADDIFAAGGEVDVSGTNAADIFVAGGEINIDGTSAKSSTVAGGSVQYRGLSTGDLITAGGELDLVRADISGDLMAAAGSLQIRPDTQVGGDALLVGGEVLIDGQIAGDLWARGGEVRLRGTIAGNVNLAGGELVIEPGSRIGGNLTYQSKEALSIPLEVVAGTTTQLGRSRVVPVEGPLGVWARIGLFAGLALAALVLYGVTPATVDGAVDRLIARPGASFFIGVAIFVALPLLALLLAITLIGLPLSLFVGALYVAGFIPSYLIAATWAGGRLAHLAGQSPAPWGARFFWLLIGLAALILTSGVPVIGVVVSGVALLFGMGALTLGFRSSARHSF